MWLNHYEFIAAGIRNGDLDETLIRDSERGTILTIYECAVDYIDSLRNTRRRRAIYEHLEWLHRRWESHPPGIVRRLAEYCRGRPFKGRRPRQTVQTSRTTSDDEHEEVLAALRMWLNHYEFIAAGIRNGDLDETLIRDSERGTILTIYECAVDYIDSLRNTRRRRAIYEHLEWLHRRWESHPPGIMRRLAEYCRGRPFKGRRERVRN